MKNKYISVILILIFLVAVVLTVCSKDAVDEETAEPTAVADYNAQFEGNSGELEGDITDESPGIPEHSENIIEDIPTSVPTLAPTEESVVAHIPTTPTDEVPADIPYPTQIEASVPDINEGGSGGLE